MNQITTDDFEYVKKIPLLASNYTVPILVYKDKKVVDIMSGVLLVVEDTYFVLTAGHVVEGFDSAKTTIYMPFGSNDRNKPARVVVRGFGRLEVYSGGEAGIIELGSSRDYDVANLKPFCITLEQIIIRESTSTDITDRAVTISGFCAELSEPNGGNFDIPHVDLLLKTTGVMGSHSMPRGLTLPSNLQGDPKYDIALWISSRETMDPNYPSAGEVEVPSLAGVSGGGYWIDASGDNEEARIALIGTHTKSSDAYIPFGDSSFRFAIGTIANCHVSLIHTNYPRLRRAIEERWPEPIFD